MRNAFRCRWGNYSPAGLGVIMLALAWGGCGSKGECKPTAESAPAPGQGITKDEIRLGMSAAFSGAAAGLGIEMWRGAAAAFSEYNLRPDVQKKVRLVLLDDQYDPAKSPENVKKLAADSNIFALFAGVGTPTLKAALPVVKELFDKEKLFYFTNFTGAQVQREAPYDKVVFNLRASYKDETKALVDFFVKEGRKKIGILIQDDAYGASGKAGVEAALKAHNLAIVSETKYPPGQVYQKSTSDEIKTLQSAGVDAIIAVGAYQPCAALVRDARVGANWTVPIANVSFVGSDQMLSLLVEEEKKAGKPIIVNLINSQVVPSYQDTAFFAVTQYREAMSRFKPAVPLEFGSLTYTPEHPLSFGSFEGYLSAKLFLAVLDKAKTGDLTRDAFYKAAESMGKFDLGVNAVAELGASRHQALDAVWLTYATADKGWLNVDPREKIIK